MSTLGAGTEGIAVGAGRPLGGAEAVAPAHSYVGAYNDRDLEAMLALQDENVVSHPVRVFGDRSLTGRAGVHTWWEAMEASGQWYQVVVSDVRLVGTDRVAILGEIRDQGELMSPWAVLFRVHNGLIIESRSYLSDSELLDELGLLERPGADDC